MIQTLMPYFSEGITALLAAFAGWFFTRRKSELEAVSEAIRIWREMAETLNTEIEGMREENRLLKSEISRLRLSNNRILKALDKLNVDNFEGVIKDLREKIGDHE